MERPYHALASFESTLFQGATRIDEQIYGRFVEALSAFEPASWTVPEVDTDFGPREWSPALRFPLDLFSYYSGNVEALSVAAREAAANDLAALRPPVGMTEGQFDRWIGMALLQTPEFQTIDKFVISSRRFGEMRDLLEARGASNGSRAWQTWMRWILHFLPEDLEFYTANYSEIVSRKR